MTNPFKNLFQTIKKSCEKDSGVSSTRLTSYVILSMIILFCLYFLGVGVYVAATSKAIVIPNELLIVFGGLLTHQLTLLGVNKYHETKQKTESKHDLPEAPKLKK